MAAAQLRPRVLVVEDDPAVGRAVTRYLNMYDVTHVETAAEAIEVVLRAPPDLVLLDHHLGDELGTTVIAAMWQHGIRIPVLMMSGQAKASVESMTHVADDFIEKPFLREALIRKLERLLTSYTIAETARKQHEELMALHERRDLETTVALAVLDRMVSRGSFDPARVRVDLATADQFSGDVICGAVLGPGCYRWMVGDVTGHTLASALVTIPISMAFYSLAERKDVLVDTVGSIDDQLALLLPVTMFCAAAVCELDRASGILYVCNAGGPDVLVRTQQGIVRVPAMDPPLAAQRPRRGLHEVRSVRVEPGDRIYAFSDGIVELPGTGGALLGIDAIISMLESVPAASGYDVIREAWQSIVARHKAEDDISLVEVIV